MDRQLAYELFCRLLVAMDGKEKAELTHRLSNGSVVVIQLEIKPGLELVKDKDTG